MRTVEMSAGGCYQVGKDEMREVIRGLTELTAQIQATVGQLGGLTVAGGCFGGVGTSVATANASTQAQTVATMTALVSLLRELNRRMTTTVDGYDRADRSVADVLRTLAASDRFDRPMR
nr:hypothetical protein [Micromonospora sp. DSM 115978]